MKRIAALALVVLAFGTNAALGYDASALNVLGFSPDGRYFAFAQEGDNEGGHYSITIAMEVASSRMVGGSPFIGIEDNQTLVDSQAKAAKLIEQLHISSQSSMAIAVPDAKVQETVNSTSVDLLRSAAVKMLAMTPDWFGPDVRLVLNQTSRPSRKCDHGEAGIVSFGMQLDRMPLPPIKIGADKNIPYWVDCPAQYGIAGAHALRLQDGATALAVIVQYFYFGFEGPDRRFTAVTARIPRS
jgi:predicted secreted protein